MAEFGEGEPYGNARWVAMNMPPVSASAAKYMTFLIVLHMMCMGELCIVLGCLAWSLLRMYQAAARERDFGKMGYVDSDLHMRITSMS